MIALAPPSAHPVEVAASPARLCERPLSVWPELTNGPFLSHKRSRPEWAGLVFEVEQGVMPLCILSALPRGCRRCGSTPAACMRHFWQIFSAIAPSVPDLSAYATKM